LDAAEIGGRSDISAEEVGMSEVTRILSTLEQGDPQAAEQLLPLVYEELRRLAAEKMAQERSGHTLQATALVHEAYLRLVDVDKVRHWNGRRHFFAAAAEAMRRILVENARRKKQLRRGGGRHRVALSEAHLVSGLLPTELVALDEALEALEAHDPICAQIVKLRCFAGLSMAETAEVLGMSLRTTERNWTYARTWLHRQIAVGPSE
jgi:RNA polymerase sigma factor (TIGR02999 family)